MTNQLFDKATAAATCDFLQTSGQGAMAYAAWGLATPGPFDEFGAIAYSAVAQLAYAAGCNWDPEQEGPSGGQTDGCVKKEPGTANYIVRANCGTDTSDPNYLAQCAVTVQQTYQEIVQIYEFPNYNGPEVTRYEIDAIRSDGTFEHITKSGAGNDLGYLAGTKFDLFGDGECLEEGKDKPDEYIYDYTDPETGCNLQVEMLGYAVDGAGRASPAWQITAGGGTRANGGVISGDCNFAPTVVIPPFGGPPGGGGGGGGDCGPKYLPVPPDGVPPPTNEPWWMEGLREIAAGVIGELVASKIQDLFEVPIDGTIYRAVSVCEKDESGEPISEAVEVPIPYLTAPDAQIARLDAIVELLQAHKNFKQPICDDRPTLEGDWRTISFRSQESSPYGKSCLRKRFRYRSMSGVGLGELVDHWKDFTWTSGPVIVSHTGHSWGAPKVWAATADEGKRVIQHAAGEAGFDANKVGQWRISNSSSSRYGVSLPMKVDTKGGYYWVTARDGEDGRPIVATLPNS